MIEQQPKRTNWCHAFRSEVKLRTREAPRPLSRGTIRNGVSTKCYQDVTSSLGGCPTARLGQVIVLSLDNSLTGFIVTGLGLKIPEQLKCLRMGPPEQDPPEGVFKRSVEINFIISVVLPLRISPLVV